MNCVYSVASVRVCAVPILVAALVMLVPTMAQAADAAPVPAQNEPGAPATSQAVPPASHAPLYQPPKYQFLRQNEDWSVLRGVDPAAIDDPFDRIKFIPLNDDGDIWIGFGGHARTRLELWENFNFATANDDAFLLSRVSLYADLHLGEHLRFFVEGKSAFSTDRDLPGGRRTTDVDELDLQQLFADIILPLADGWGTLTIRPGRQMLLFGNQRLVSPLPWSNTLRTWDGVSLIWTIEQWKVTGFWTQFVPVQKYDFNTADGQTDFWGVYAAGKVPSTDVGLDLYLLGLNRDDPITFNGTTGTEDRVTIGARVYGKWGKSGFDYEVESAYQFGEVGQGDISAWMLAGQLGYTIADCPTNPRLWVGFDYASGDNGRGGDVETFNQLFPLGHAYFGYLDAVGRQNIIDASGGVSFKPLQKLTVGLAGHVFWLADDDDAFYNAGGGITRAAAPGSDRFIGGELDVTLQYVFTRHISALLGYSRFFAADFLGQTGPAADTDFGYLELQFTF